MLFCQADGEVQAARQMRRALNNAHSHGKVCFDFYVPGEFDEDEAFEALPEDEYCTDCIEFLRKCPKYDIALPNRSTEKYKKTRAYKDLQDSN